jgi:hypothetical protein
MFLSSFTHNCTIHVNLFSKQGGFDVTTHEPYAVCCVEGLKISREMHKLGKPQRGLGSVDNARSHSDQNTRNSGDLTKSIALAPIVDKMKAKLTNDPVWQGHFGHLTASFSYRLPAFGKQLAAEVTELVKRHFRLKRLQTQLFELGNNWYVSYLPIFLGACFY